MLLGYAASGVFPDGMVGGPSARVGVLSQISDAGSIRGLNLRLDLSAAPGDSGGPVVDSGGLVVGMVRAVDPGSQFVYAIHQSEIEAALPALRQERSR